MGKLNLSPEARAAQRAYNRQYYRANRDKRRAIQARYWEKRAKLIAARAAQSEEVRQDAD